MIRFALLSLLVACAHAAPVAPTNYAYAAARANFPTGDSIAVGEKTALVRDGLVLAICIETDAAHHTQCVAVKDYTPEKKPESAKTADVVKPTEPPAAAAAPPATPAKPEAPKKK